LTTVEKVVYYKNSNCGEYKMLVGQYVKPKSQSGVYVRYSSYAEDADPDPVARALAIISCTSVAFKGVGQIVEVITVNVPFGNDNTIELEDCLVATLEGVPLGWVGSGALLPTMIVKDWNIVGHSPVVDKDTNV